MNHRIILSEVLGSGEAAPVRVVRGYLASIEPPVNLNPQVIDASIATRKVRRPEVGDDRSKLRNAFRSGTLIGSTVDRDVIYADLAEELRVESTRREVTLGRMRTELTSTFSELFALMQLEEPEFVIGEPIYAPASPDPANTLSMDNGNTQLSPSYNLL